MRRAGGTAPRLGRLPLDQSNSSLDSKKNSNEFHDWPLDSTFDSRNLTTTRELDDFMATLGGPVPLSNIGEHLLPYAKQMEADIDVYLNGNNKDMQAKCIIAQEILRHGIERSPELTDELYLQLLKHLRGSNKNTSVRGWELLLLAACASRPSSRFVETVNNFVHSASHARVQWPTTVSILAKRTWTALKHNSKPGRRVNVPSVGEIASVLSSKSMKIQITFVDGSNKWLFYDWTTTVSSAVEQLAAQIGLKNYEDYTLFEVRKVPKKLDTDGAGSVATLPPDSYLLLEDDRRIADVLHDYEVRGAQNKLLLKRRRFDASEADFSKPQFIALTEAHQAAMDEKVAEVANLTLRLREMSGKVMWFEVLQEEKAAQVESLKQELEATRSKAKNMELEGVSVDMAEVMRERDYLAEKVRQLEASVARRASTEMGDVQGVSDGDWKPLGLMRKLGEKQEEAKRMQVELDVLRAMVPPEDLEKAAALTLERTASGTRTNGVKSELHEDVEADMSEKEALYDLLRLQTSMEDEHAEDLALKDQEIEHLKQMVEALAPRSSRILEGGRANIDGEAFASPASIQHDDSRELRRSLDTGSLSNAPGHRERLELATATSMALEGRVSSLQEALDHQTELKADLEYEVEELKQQLECKESGSKAQEKEWRVQLNTAKTELATLRSRLKSKETALIQITAELDELHKEAGRLKTELDTKEWELECANSSLAAAVNERNAAQAAVKQLKVQSGSSSAFKSSADEANRLAKKEQEVGQLTQKLMEIAVERDAALEKLSGIQQLMFGMGQGTLQLEHTNGRSRKSLEREGKYKAVNDNCPLEIGKDPRRESIGGASAPSHLKGLPPLRVLPEDKRSYGTRHPLFAPKYVSPLVAATPDKRIDLKNMRQEAAAMLSAADARRRLNKQQGQIERPAPMVQTTPRMTDRINSGTHLLGLLSNIAITKSHDSLGDGEDSNTLLTSGGVREDFHGAYGSDLMRTNSSFASHENGPQSVVEASQGRHVPGMEGKSNILNSGGLSSTQSEPDLLKAYEQALRSGAD